MRPDDATVIITDTTSTDVTHDPRFPRGCIPPDYKMHPEATPLRKVNPSELKLIDPSEYKARCDERKRLKSTLRDVRQTSGPGRKKRIPALNQNDGRGRWGYCWAHSSTMAHMLLRALMGQEYVKLSAFMVAAIIKNYRDQGGWGALSLDFIEKNGQCTCDEWPELGVDPKYDTPAMRAVAAQYKVTADWADLSAQMWDRNMTMRAVATLLLSNVPVVADYNWWGHSVVLMDWVEIEPGSFGPVGLNSWGEDWGEDGGEFKLQGQKAITDGAVAPMAATILQARKSAAAEKKMAA